jgi:hypothetical protein
VTRAPAHAEPQRVGDTPDPSRGLVEFREADQVCREPGRIAGLPAVSQVPGCSDVEPEVATTAPGVPVAVVRGGHVATAVIESSDAGRAFLARLPVTVRLRDSFRLAWVGELTPELAVSDRELTCAVGIGTIGYSPADQALAIYYSEDAGRLRTGDVVRLGTVTGQLSALAGDGPVSIVRVG